MDVMHEIDTTPQQLQSANGHPDHTLLKVQYMRVTGREQETRGAEML